MVTDPYKLLNEQEMSILKAHYNLVKDCRSQDETERALKGWSQQQRRVVIRLQEKIRLNGWSIDGQFPSGSLRFATLRRSPMDQIMSLSDDDFRLYKQGMLRFVGGELRRVEA